MVISRTVLAVTIFQIGMMAGSVYGQGMSGRQTNIEGTILIRHVQYASGTPSAEQYHSQFGLELSNGRVMSLDNVPRGAIPTLSNVTSAVDHVRISSGVASHGTLRLDDGARVTVLPPSASGSTRRSRRTVPSGTKRVLVIRSTGASVTTPSEDDLRADVFGECPAGVTGCDAFNLKSGYIACSHNTLQFEPFNGVTLTGETVDRGVVTVTVSQRARNRADDRLKSAMESAAISLVGNLNQFDNVMFCLPPGTGNWVAYAWLGGTQSVYNDVWCQKASAQIHELGHNLGLGHSRYNGCEYCDTTCMMGYSYFDDDYPVMCFNPAKIYQLGITSSGWFQKPTGIADFFIGDPDLTWSGRLVGVNGDSSGDAVVALKIHKPGSGNDWFVGFNDATGINRDTGACGATDTLCNSWRNAVTIHRKTPPDNGGNPSDLVTSLSQGQSWTVPDDGRITVTVTSIVSSPTPSATISITCTGTGCAPSPTQSPTLSPTQSPTQPASPTQSPTLSPTQSPTLSPTQSPTQPGSPTQSPTLSPTQSPTLFPTQSPTVSPTETSCIACNPRGGGGVCVASDCCSGACKGNRCDAPWC